MRAFIIAVEPGGHTSRMFDRMGVEYSYVACECGKERFAGCDNVLYYKCTGRHGSNIARRHALDFGDCVVFDDDYSGLLAMGMAGSGLSSVTYRDAETLWRVLGEMKRLEDSEHKLIVGGYSAGSPCGVESRFKKNIMQVFFSGKINKFFRADSNLYRNNDDVCACIMAKRRGYATFGLWSLMRSVQTPEQQDNTNNYDSRSYSKSFLPILYAPTACKVVWCKDKRLAGGKIRPGRFHHIVHWSKITPKMVERS